MKKKEKEKKLFSFILKTVVNFDSFKWLCFLVNVPLLQLQYLRQQISDSRVRSTYLSELQ